MIGKLTVSTEKLLGTIREFCKVDTFKVNVLKSIVFFYINNNKLEI